MNYLWHKILALDDCFLNAIINLLVITFGIIPIIELIYHKSSTANKSNAGSFFYTIKTFYRRISWRGWWLIFFAFAIIVFNFAKDMNTKHKQELSDRAKAEVDLKLQASQSEIMQLQKSTNTSVMKAVDLSQYHIKISDSLRAELKKIKISSIDPQLSLVPCDVGKQPVFLSKDKEQDILNIQFKSNNGTSRHIKLVCYILIRNNHRYEILQQNGLFFGDANISDDRFTTSSINIPRDLLAYTETLILITGTFSKDTEGNSPVPFNVAFEYNFKENKYILGDWEYEKLKKQIINFNQ